MEEGVGDFIRTGTPAGFMDGPTTTPLTCSVEVQVRGSNGDVIYQTRQTVFYQNIQTLRSEFKRRNVAHFF